MIDIMNRGILRGWVSLVTDCQLMMGVMVVIGKRQWVLLCTVGGTALVEALCTSGMRTTTFIVCFPSF